MKRDRMPTALALLVAAAFAACEKGQADAATPAIIADVTIGSQVGPVPGADRPVRHVANPYADDPASPAGEQ